MMNVLITYVYPTPASTMFRAQKTWPETVFLIFFLFLNNISGPLYLQFIYTQIKLMIF